MFLNVISNFIKYINLLKGLRFALKYHDLCKLAGDMHELRNTQSDKLIIRCKISCK